MTIGESPTVTTYYRRGLVASCGFMSAPISGSGAIDKIAMIP